MPDLASVLLLCPGGRAAGVSFALLLLPLPCFARRGCEHPRSPAGQGDPPPRSPLCAAPGASGAHRAAPGQARPGEQSQAFVWPIKLVLTWLLGASPAHRGRSRPGGSAEGLRCTCGRGLGYREPEHEKETFQADGASDQTGSPSLTYVGTSAPQLPRRPSLVLQMLRFQGGFGASAAAGAGLRGASRAVPAAVALSVCQGGPAAAPSQPARGRANLDTLISL